MHPKDAFKYCPACGKRGMMYNNKVNYLKCISCGFQYFINEAGAVAAIITDKEGRILFTKRAKAPAKNKLDLPGGFVDIGETAEHALEREIKEELDISLSSYRYFMSQPNKYIFGDMTYFTLDLAYICQAESFDNIKALDDISGIRFIAPEEVNPDDIGLASIKEIIKQYLNSLNSTS